ncbi:hypothetical protein BASA62_000033 [Batrachochytrium salamandrivorans]|nr:hypothetical protein BASA62_000033 [Batrachochytrium salamandrivorans]
MKFSLFATVSALFATAMVTGAAPIQRQPGNEGLNRQDQRNDALSRYSHRERHGQPNKGPAQPEQEARALSTSQRVNGALNRAHSKDRPNSDRSAAARGIKQSIQNPNTSN